MLGLALFGKVSQGFARFRKVRLGLFGFGLGWFWFCLGFVTELVNNWNRRPENFMLVFWKESTKEIVILFSNDLC